MVDWFDWADMVTHLLQIGKGKKGRDDREREKKGGCNLGRRGEGE